MRRQRHLLVWKPRTVFDTQRRATTCAWRLSVDGYWATACGRAWWTEAASPTEDDGMVFCPYCGRRIREEVPPDLQEVL